VFAVTAAETDVYPGDRPLNFQKSGRALIF
jgi:hypothetical protein